jgi:hypothetical protein
VILFSLAIAVGCGGAGETSKGLTNGGSCHWPDGVSAATDASTKGCAARSAFNICEVAPDGRQTCTDACSSSQYSLTCDQASPAAEWGCTAIPIPTPANVLVYCCPCR